MYAIWLKYEELKGQKQMYDDGDLVWDIYARLMLHGYEAGAVIHQLYVDEVQVRAILLNAHYLSFVLRRSLHLRPRCI